MFPFPATFHTEVTIALLYICLTVLISLLVISQIIIFHTFSHRLWYIRIMPEIKGRVHLNLGIIMWFALCFKGTVPPKRNNQPLIFRCLIHTVTDVWKDTIPKSDSCVCLSKLANVIKTVTENMNSWWSKQCKETLKNKLLCTVCGLRHFGFG